MVRAKNEKGRRVTAGEVSELADEHDLGSCALKGVGVRVPPSPPGQ